MRTPQKTVSTLIRDAKSVLGVRHRKDVFNRIHTVQEELKARLDVESFVARPLIYGPYMNSRWGVYWLGQGCGENWVEVPLDALTDVERIVQRITRRIDHA